MKRRDEPLDCVSLKNPNPEKGRVDRGTKEKSEKEKQRRIQRDWEREKGLQTVRHIDYTKKKKKKKKRNKGRRI